jgi:hypothetical protein
VYYLKALTWEAPDFSVGRSEKELREVNDEITDRGSYEVRTERFYLVASK